MLESNAILVISPDGSFEVRQFQYNCWSQVAWAIDLDICIKQAAQRLGRPIVIPLSMPNSDQL